MNYGGRSSDIWWDKIGAGLARSDNLTVIDIASETVDALAALADRGMRLQCMVQDGQVELYGEGASVAIDKRVRMAPADAA